MAHLYPHLRIHQVFGANTDVGKTLFTTALCLASSVLPLPSTAVSHEQDVQNAMRGTSEERRGEAVHYLKPVSTGPMSDSDDGHIARFSHPTSQQTLLRFPDPVSPHLAARLASPSQSPLQDCSRLPTDAELVRSIGRWLSAKAMSSPSKASVAFVETAGGPHSPSPTGSSQIHLLRPLRLPTILVGDSNLGGISTTRSAYESLFMAGHQVDAVMLFENDKWGNAEYLKQWGKEFNIPVWGLAGLTDSGTDTWGGPPQRAASQGDDEANMRQFYRGLLYGRARLMGAETTKADVGVVDVVRHLRQQHVDRMQELDTYAQRTRDSCWWPTTQHTLAKSNADVTVIDSAYGDFFSTFTQSQTRSTPGSSRLAPMLDGSASWWTQALGHSHPKLAIVAAQAAGRYGHVLFPMAANEPALKLAEGLLGRLPEQTKTQGRLSEQPSPDHNFPAPGADWADRVFYSDDGSTGMEVALKMALASAKARYAPAAMTRESSDRVSQGRKAGTLAGRQDREWKVLGLKGSYHGDTIGAMDASEPSVYSNMVHWYRGRGAWIDPPTVGIVAGQPTITLPDSTSEPAFKSVAEGSSDLQTRRYGSLEEIYNVNARIAAGDPLLDVYTKVISTWLDRVVRLEGNRFGALLLEPMVLGAAGMVFVDPLFQRVLVDVVRRSEELFALTDPPLRDAKAAVGPSSSQGWTGLPVIFDEVFTGLYRLGPLTPSTVLGVSPDISCLAKILTGGLVPLSVTLASKSIYDIFLSAHDRKEEALLHGHSYTAHPIGCEVARETLRTLATMDQGRDWAGAKEQWAVHSGSSAALTKAQQSAPTSSTATPTAWSFWSPEFVHDLSRHFADSVVAETMALGCVLVVKLREPPTHEGQSGGYSSKAAAELVARLRTSANVDTDAMDNPAVPDSSRAGPASAAAPLPFKVHARPLGNVVYIMCSLNTPEEVRSEVQRALWSQLLLEAEKRSETVAA
ncbi:unnamed protein product [Parajaminaea phylloscopi]